MSRILFILAFLAGLLAGPLGAQAPAAEGQKFLVAVDTAGIMPVGQDTYMTWIFALSSPTSFPSSGILVAFNCKDRLVKRLAHVVYEWNDDSTGVRGPIVEDDLPWVAVTDTRLYELVCRIGPTHPESVQKATPRRPSWDGTSIS